MIDLLDNDERFIAQLGIGWMVRLRKKTRQGKGGRGLVMMGWFDPGRLLYTIAQPHAQPHVQPHDVQPPVVCYSTLPGPARSSANFRRAASAMNG